MGFKRRANAIASVEKKKQHKQPSPLQQEISALDDQNEGCIDATSSDAMSNVEMDDDDDAKVRWRELKAAKTEEEEIERYRRQQAGTHTKAEAEHNEDLHQVRLRRMRARKAGREAERKAAQTHEAAHELTLGADWNAYNQAQGNGDSETTKIEGSPASTSRASSAGMLITNARQRKHELRLIPGDRAAFFTSKHPSLKRTDSEIFPEADQPIPWRNTKRQRVLLNTDQSRIESDFILSDEFIDDVNTMLDFVAGWRKELFKEIRYSFKKEPENKNRRIKFARMRDDAWAVRLLKPDKLESERHPGLADAYTFDDLPDDCREYGCLEGCPRKIPMKEKIANLKRFREDQAENKPLHIMAKACNTASPAPGALLDACTMPPPPIPPRSDKRRVPYGVQDINSMSKRSSTTLKSLTSAQKSPETPRMKSHDLPSAKTSADRLEQLQRMNTNLENQVRQLKAMMSQKKSQSVGGKGIEMASEWLQSDLGSDIEPKALQSGRKDSIFDRLNSGPLGRKLVHVDKIPSGPNSVSVEGYMLTSVFDRRSKIPGLRDENVRHRPREDYYAERIPPKSDSQSKGSAAPPPSPRRTKKSHSNTVDQPLSTITARIKFRPQYERNPDAY
ncbi:hypothetical protein EKO04_000231 [Ascochyta lentis]|uniref:Uncharacterized protein n=1 Tax=Ascochyta lentis TaxID=205686 RepID=A0A8H7JD24_9PLEO|nr:hypothetical protein EKO04_000231 [Ascochyta lentis]